MPWQWTRRHASISSISWPASWSRSFAREGEAMTEIVYSPKIKPEHLARKAIVYLRQSSDRQVRQNKESQHLQYAVAERVRALGWKQVEIINNDLGSSAGLAAAQREGFERVLSSVALGEVGIVGSREVSRLSRTDKDWCRLLEVCQIFGTLIADEQQVYDLNNLDDQLVLGIKGTLSVVELKVIRQRIYGRPQLTRNINALPPASQNGGFGIPSVTTHLHNAHNPSESDGNPCDFYGIGNFCDQYYPNVLAGFNSDFAPNGDINEALSTKGRDAPVAGARDRHANHHRNRDQRVLRIDRARRHADELQGHLCRRCQRDEHRRGA